MKKYVIPLLLLCSLFVLEAQEALVSQTEGYYDFLSLQGLVKRPTLNYRTLSDSVWDLGEDTDHVWKGNTLGTTYRFFNFLDTRFYGPELYMSVNTAAPYGQNDGALWQGKGFNTSLSGGIRLEAYGVALTFKPQLSFSQNLRFDYMTPNYSGTLYEGKADTYGYYGLYGIDAPQRFGDEPFFTFDWGDSEIRYSWKTLTIGFGTQAIWLGPAQINPIINSNNAASYPKLDLGVRKQSIDFLGIHWGFIEARTWWGYLSESDHFDNDSSNDHNLITGFSIAYGVPFLPGLSIGLNRVLLSKWDNMNAEALFIVIWPFMKTSAGYDENDQRASIVLDYLLPIAGLNIYLEWGRNDYSPGLDYVLRYPFHTRGYTVGIKKSLNISKRFKGEILLEITNLECSQDYDRIISWSSTFYAHRIVTQGHTNRGQWLGAGIGTGGNSQYIGFKLYFPKGFGQLFFQRRNPDMDYTWFIDSKNNPTEAETNIRVCLDFGLSGLYYITNGLSIAAQFVLVDEHNPLYNSSSSGSFHRINCAFSALIKYEF